jgi:hypothetical protein
LREAVNQNTQMARGVPAPFEINRSGDVGEIQPRKRQDQHLIEDDPSC